MNLTLKNLLSIYVLVIILVAVFGSKIYITSQIYYTSLQINSLKNRLNLLIAENKQFHAMLQIERYKNQVTKY